MAKFQFDSLDADVGIMRNPDGRYGCLSWAQTMNHTHILKARGRNLNCAQTQGPAEGPAEVAQWIPPFFATFFGE